MAVSGRFFEFYVIDDWKPVFFASWTHYFMKKNDSKTGKED